MIKKNNLLSLSILLAVCALIFYLGSCNKSTSKYSNNYNYDNININLIRNATNFDDLFKLEKEIPLTGKLIGSIQKLKYGKNGNIYIIDSATRHLNIFDPQGKFLRTVGGIGDGPGEYLTANDFVIDDSLNIYILDGRLRRIMIFDSYGDLKHTLKIDDFGQHMIIAGDLIYLYSSMNMGGGKTAYCYNIKTGQKIFEFAGPTTFLKLLISNKYLGVMLNCNCLEYFDNKIYLINPLQYVIREFGLHGQQERVIYGKSDDFKPIDPSRKLSLANFPKEYVQSVLNNIKVNNNLIIVSFISSRQKPCFLDLYTLDGERINKKSIMCPNQFSRISFFPLDIDKSGSFYGYTQPQPDRKYNLPNPIILKYKFLAYRNFKEKSD